MLPDFTAIGYIMAATLVPISLSFKYCDMLVEDIDALWSRASDRKALPVHALIYSVDSLNSTHIKCLEKLVANFESLKCLCLSAKVKGSEHDLAVVIGLLHNSCSDFIELSLENISISKNTLEVILPEGNKIEKLALIQSIDSSEVKALADGLRRSENLKELNVDDNNLSGKEARVIAESLKFCKKIETVSMKENCLSSGDVSTIQQTLIRCKHVELFPKEVRLLYSLVCSIRTIHLWVTLCG